MKDKDKFRRQRVGTAEVLYDIVIFQLILMIASEEKSGIFGVAEK